MRDAPASQTAHGDLDAASFRHCALRLVDWIGRYLDGGVEAFPVLARVRPGEIAASLPPSAPAGARPMTEILDDFERLLVPGLTHWNHPGFMAYFPSSASGPAVLAEFLTAALNQQAMLWRTSPAATELEGVALGWLRELLGVPACFEGALFEGGSSSNLHALLAARQQSLGGVRTRGLLGRADLAPVRIYCSEHAHSSIDKAAIVLGLGQDAVCKVPTDGRYRLSVDALSRAMDEDATAGTVPLAVVATVGTTSCGAADPVAEMAELCRAHRVWLHVDASWAGAAAILPEQRAIFEGVGQADSIVVNPHKWLFTGLDQSALYCRRMDELEAALALTPDYLATAPTEGGRNLMDRGVALGRRFRALKLWVVLSCFGADGLRQRLREHIRLAGCLGEALSMDPDFELVAPVSLGLVCFRAAPMRVSPGELDALNATLVERVNASGEVFLSSTRLSDRTVLRLVVGHLRTGARHVQRARELLRSALDDILSEAR